MDALAQCPQCGQTFTHEWNCPRKEVPFLDEGLELARASGSKLHEARKYLHDTQEHQQLKQEARALAERLSVTEAQAFAFLRDRRRV